MASTTDFRQELTPEQRAKIEEIRDHGLSALLERFEALVDELVVGGRAFHLRLPARPTTLTEEVAYWRQRPPDGGGWTGRLAVEVYKDYARRYGVPYATVKAAFVEAGLHR